MFDIYIIQAPGSSWKGVDYISEITATHEGQEDFIYVSTDAVNQEFISTLGLKKFPAMVFIRPIGEGRYVVMDRIVEPITKLNMEQRYLAARNSPIIFGDYSGVPLGDIVDFNSSKGDDQKNDPFGFGILPFNIYDWPAWVWLLLTGVTSYKAVTSRRQRYLWMAASGFGLFQWIQKRKK